MAKVLLVDDDAAILRALEIALKARQYEVLTASNPEDAEAAALAEHPDIIVADVMMPTGTEGFHLVWKLRQSEDAAVRGVPIILATGIHEHTSLRLYPEQTDGTYTPGEFLPIQGWLDKPIGTEKLLAMLEKALS
jgi:two-component system sensor histidine kinase/response regulator